MGCPGGMSTMRYGRLVFYIHSLSLYISREKGDHILFHPNEAQ